VRTYMSSIIISHQKCAVLLPLISKSPSEGSDDTGGSAIHKSKGRPISGLTRSTSQWGKQTSRKLAFVEKRGSQKFRIGRDVGGALSEERNVCLEAFGSETKIFLFTEL